MVAAAEESADRAVVVAVTGLTGVGKSALALEAGHSLRATFPDGALYHDAANDPNDAGVATALATFLRLLGDHPGIRSGRAGVAGRAVPLAARRSAGAGGGRQPRDGRLGRPGATT